MASSSTALCRGVGHESRERTTCACQQGSLVSSVWRAPMVTPGGWYSSGHCLCGYRRLAVTTGVSTGRWLDTPDICQESGAERALGICARCCQRRLYGSSVDSVAGAGLSPGRSLPVLELFARYTLPGLVGAGRNGVVVCAVAGAERQSVAGGSGPGPDVAFCLGCCQRHGNASLPGVGRHCAMALFFR